MSKPKYVIASDHAGFDLKEAIKVRYADTIEFMDLGPYNADRVDYPDFGAALGQAMTDGEAERGIVICGSGIGISIAANRYPAVRAALCMTPEMARLSRQHNDANVLALGERLIEKEEAFEILEAFIEEEFEGGRHAGRVEKLTEIKP